LVQNDLVAARGQATAARAELNALLAYPGEAAVPLADPLEAGPVPAVQAVTQQALAGNAELQVLDRRIEEARARVALADALRHPDPSVSAALTYDAPGEFTVGWRAGAATARAAAARQALDRYQADILPASLQVEQMAEESYRAGQTGLPAYLQTLQAARDVRQRALQAGLDYQLALAELERTMGVPLR